MTSSFSGKSDRNHISGKVDNSTSSGPQGSRKVPTSGTKVLQQVIAQAASNSSCQAHLHGSGGMQSELGNKKNPASSSKIQASHKEALATL